MQQTGSAPHGGVSVFGYEMCLGQRRRSNLFIGCVAEYAGRCNRAHQSSDQTDQA